MKLKDWCILIFISLLTIINVFVLALILSNDTLKNIVSLSGSLGDTVGGILGPTLGIFSAYFVYKAFEEQRRANQLLQSDIARQSAIMELTELRNNLEIITYEKDSIVYIGRQIASKISVPYEQSESYGYRISGSYDSYTSVCNHLANYLNELHELWSKSNSSLINEDHRKFIRSMIKKSLETYLTYYYPILSELKNSVELLSQNSNDYDGIFDPFVVANLDGLVSIVTSTVDNIERLERDKLLSVEVEKFSSFDEFLDSISPVGLDGLKRKGILRLTAIG